MNTDPSPESPAELTCRAMVAAPDTAAGELMFLPGGVHKITPSQGGKAIKVQVRVDRDSAVAIEQQRQEIVARTGKRPYFDLNHEDQAASFWPAEFFWQDGPMPGVYARGKWTKAGREGIEGHNWRQFSPVFFVDDVKAKPAKIICNASAKPNMGGLVNDPAFPNIAPLWAKEADAAEELVSKQRYDALRAEMEELLAKNKEHEESELARHALACKEAVDDAVKRGALFARDFQTQEAFVEAARRDPTFIQAIKAMAGNVALGPPITRAATAAALHAKQDRTGTYRVV